MIVVSEHVCVCENCDCVAGTYGTQVITCQKRIIFVHAPSRLKLKRIFSHN